MMMAPTDYIQERKITQSRVARIMGVSQARISGLVRGKIGLFTIDTTATGRLPIGRGLTIRPTMQHSRNQTWGGRQLRTSR